ncbi:MAG TPA: hypothetical protein VFX03_12065, partial [Thermomicrobiales bacterium]|nr:hypothetical protein [Thermomicrobiales bacterium]
MQGYFNDFVNNINTLVVPHNDKYAAADAQLLLDCNAVVAARVAAMQGYSQLIATFQTAAAKAMFDAATLTYNKGMALAYYANRVIKAAADLAYTTGFDGYLNAYEHQVDAAATDRDITVAGYLDDEEHKLHAAELAMDKTQADHDEWDANNRAAAVSGRADAVALAEENYAVAMAQARQRDADALSLAVHDFEIRMADARSERQTSDADALATATASWAAAEGTPWAAEQATIAADAAAYTGSVAPEQDTLTHEKQDAAYDAAVAIHGADESRDADVAGDQYAETLVEDAENLDLANDKADATHTRAYDDAAAWQANQDKSSDIDQTFTVNVAGKQAARSDADADAIQRYEDGMATCVYQSMLTLPGAVPSPSIAAAWAAILAQFPIDLEANRVNYQLGEIDEKSSRAKGKTQAAYDYQVTYHGDEATWAKALESAAQDDEEHTATAIDAQAKLDAAAVVDDVETTAGEQAGEATTDAADEATFFNDQAGFQQTEDVADANAQASFEETTADDYANELSSWAAGITGPGAAWANEQAQMAAADAAWITSVAPAQTLDVSETDGAAVTWTTL